MSDNASQVIWDWRSRGSDQFVKELRQKNRLHGGLQGMVALIVGGAFLYFKHPIPASFAFAMGVFILLASQIWPLGLYVRFQKSGVWLGRVMGAITAYLLLIPVYWLFFSPFHFFFRRGTKNKMNPQPNPQATSYWEDRSDPTPDHYERQF